MYVGEYRNNLINGQGTRTWLDGSTYVGEQMNGKKNGQGVFTNSDGEIQSGLWNKNTFLG